MGNGGLPAVALRFALGFSKGIDQAKRTGREAGRRLTMRTAESRGGTGGNQDGQ